MRSAITIIRGEHRSLAAVLHGLRFLVEEIRDRRVEPDFNLLYAMLDYIDSFPKRFHHPKEDAYLFRLIRMRTKEADNMIAELEGQHIEDRRKIEDLRNTLNSYRGNMPGAAEEFRLKCLEYCDFTWKHLRTEEECILPLAEKVYTDEDWQEINEAFNAHSDPLFGIEADNKFRNLFSMIVNSAPPPIGVGSEWRTSQKQHAAAH